MNFTKIIFTVFSIALLCNCPIRAMLTPEEQKDIGQYLPRLKGMSKEEYNEFDNNRKWDCHKSLVTLVDLQQSTIEEQTKHISALEATKRALCSEMENYYLAPKFPWKAISLTAVGTAATIGLVWMLIPKEKTMPGSSCGS